MEISVPWYFTPYYSILRATTDTFMWVLIAAVSAYGVLLLAECRSPAANVSVIAVTGAILVGLVVGDARMWGVVLMGCALMVFFLLPWLDRSPVRSMRYKGPIAKSALGLFATAFVVLGYCGTQPVTPAGTLISQVCTLIYFGFFLLMPWYTTIDETKLEPARLVWEDTE